MRCGLLLPLESLPVVLGELLLLLILALLPVFWVFGLGYRFTRWVSGQDERTEEQRRRDRQRLACAVRKPASEVPLGIPAPTSPEDFDPALNEPEEER